MDYAPPAVYREFPFVKDGKGEWWMTPNYATVMAGILAIVARPALPTVPLIGVSANTPGTGKTKIVESAVIAAIGHKPTVVSFPGEDEFAKSLVPLLREADRATLIDNVSIPLTGDMLCSVLTSEEHRARILGQSEQVRLLNKTAFFATGNNLAIQGDLTRRAFQVELDAECERPEQRKFDFDPVTLAGYMHPALCIAALTALRAYILAGKPWTLERPVIGSFEESDRLVCGCLTWCGFADPTITADNVIGSDPDRESNLELLTTWHETYRDPVSVTQTAAHNNQVYDLLAHGEWNARAVGDYNRIAVRHMTASPEHGPVVLIYGCSECNWIYRALTPEEAAQISLIAQFNLEQHGCSQHDSSDNQSPPPHKKPTYTVRRAGCVSACFTPSR